MPPVSRARWRAWSRSFVSRASASTVLRAPISLHLCHRLADSLCRRQRCLRSPVSVRGSGAPHSPLVLGSRLRALSRYALPATLRKPGACRPWQARSPGRAFTGCSPLPRLTPVPVAGQYFLAMLPAALRKPGACRPWQARSAGGRFTGSSSLPRLALSFAPCGLAPALCAGAAQVALP